MGHFAIMENLPQGCVSQGQVKFEQFQDFSNKDAWFSTSPLLTPS